MVCFTGTSRKKTDRCQSLFLAGARGIPRYVCVAFRKVNFAALLLAIAQRSSGFAGTDRGSISHSSDIKIRPADADRIFMAGARGIEPRS